VTHFIVSQQIISLRESPIACDIEYTEAEIYIITKWIQGTL